MVGLLRSATLWIQDAPRIIQEARLRYCGDMPRVIDSAETLRIIASEGISFSRFGDGEFDLILGRNIGFQNGAPALAERLRWLLSGNANNENYRVGIPWALSSFEGLNRRSRRWWLHYCACNRAKIQPLLGKVDYLDAQATRFYVNRANKQDAAHLLALWKSLWGARRVLVVEGESSRFGVGNDLFENAAAVGRILCPAKNAFGHYDDILQAACKHAPAYDLVLLVLGPTATVLAYDLSAAGFWTVDSGNLDMEYEWFLRDSRRPIRIEGKYTVEALGGTEGLHPANDLNDLYESQILARVAVAGSVGAVDA